MKKENTIEQPKYLIDLVPVFNGEKTIEDIMGNISQELIVNTSYKETNGSVFTWLKNKMKNLINKD